MLHTHSALRISHWVLVVGGCSILAGASHADEQADDPYTFALWNEETGGDGARFAAPDDEGAEGGQGEVVPDLALDQEDEWTFSVVPYLWMASVRTDTTLGPVNAQTDLCFTDLLSSLEFAGMLRGEARKGSWGFYAEGLYLHLFEDTTVRRRRNGLRPRIGIDVDGELIQANVGLGGFYRFGEADRYFDVMLGGRYTYLKVDSNIAFLNPSGSKNLFDPIIGCRVGLELSDRWFTQFRGDVGGFGAGSEITWGVQGVFGYRMSDMTSLIFGYRYYAIDIDSGSFRLDAQYYGPLIALGFKF